MESILLSWSGGKDCARSLHEIRRAGAQRVETLLTTLATDLGRVQMHGVRKALLEDQVRALGESLQWIEIPVPCPNGAYEAAMEQALRPWIERGVTTCAFGDIFLEDLRAYRDAKLAAVGMRASYPIWKRDSRELAHEFVEQGFRAIVTCVDTRALDASFAGSVIDERFLAELPASVDPCGENGEYHTFVFDGPIFTCPVRFEVGERFERDGFVWSDLVPESPSLKT